MPLETEQQTMGEEETKPFGRNTCHICGSVDFEWGHLLTRRSENTYYVSDDRSTMQKFLGTGLKTVRAPPPDAITCSSSPCPRPNVRTNKKPPFDNFRGSVDKYN
ncbi:MAG: hypothetical protein U0694_22825 [Anaerolineae bacterium]